MLLSPSLVLLVLCLELSFAAVSTRLIAYLIDKERDNYEIKDVQIRYKVYKLGTHFCTN